MRAIIVPSGRESCETVTTVFVSRPLPSTGGNEARGLFRRKLDSGDGGERPRGARSGAPLANMYVALYADEAVPYREIVRVLNIANENHFMKPEYGP